MLALVLWASSEWHPRILACFQGTEAFCFYDWGATADIILNDDFADSATVGCTADDCRVLYLGERDYG
jgi:hypothetical protein